MMRLLIVVALLILCSESYAAPGDKTSPASTAFTTFSSPLGKVRAAKAKDTITVQGSGATAVSIAASTKTITISSPVPDWTTLLNKPTFLRGYDGREVELQTTATHIQWRYVGILTWTNLVPLSAITGANGKTYGCYVTGGIQTITYDKNGSNPAPNMVAFGAEMREDGSVITPSTYAWGVPATGSLLSGSATGATFTPAVAGSFSAGAADNRVFVTVTYGSISCKATVPVAVTKVGADGLPATPENKQQLYTRIGVATNGDVLNTQAGDGDADNFAFRTKRAKGGDIHQTDLAVGQTWIHARPTDAATAPKMGIKNTGGTPVMQFNADGSFTGTLVIR